MVENEQPDFIVHYNRGKPFRSITSLDDSALNRVLRSLNEENSWGLARFSNHLYLSQRREIERSLRMRFIENGGRPILENPIYFFLGRNPRFEENTRNIGYALRLGDLDPRTISFSYGDSMFCFHEGNRQQAGESYQNPLCDGFYSLENLPQLLAHQNFPKLNPLHIEGQLWSLPSRELFKKITE